MSINRLVLGILGLVLSTSLWAKPEPTGKIAGRIYDVSTRTPVFGVAVSVLEESLGSYTDKNGVFIITDVPAGTYSVEATMISYRSQVKTSVVVEPSRTTEVVFQLTQGSVDVKGVTVRPDYFPKVADATVSERSFSAEEIQAQPGGLGDIQRVVQTLPSVVSFGDQNEVVVRGGDMNENLFLVDGIEVPYPNHFGMYDHQGGPFNILNPLLIREVDFVAGAFPARYGERVSSVMDIAMKRGSVTDFAGNFDVAAGGVRLTAEGPLPLKTSSFTASYMKSFLGILYEAGFLPNTYAVPDFSNYFAKVSLGVFPGNEIYALVLAGEDDYDEEADTSSPFSYDLGLVTRRIATGAGWQKFFGEIGSGKLLLFGSSTSWDYLRNSRESENDTIESALTREQSWGARYDVSLTWLGTQETQFGTSASWIPFSYDYYMAPDTIFYYPDTSDTSVRFPLIDSTTGEVFAREADVNSSIGSYKLAGYLQHKIALGDFAHLSLGMRADYFAYTDKFYLSPRVGLTTRPILWGICVNLGYGRHYQPPAFHILVRDTVANHFLESKRSDHYVLGLERLITDDTKLSIEVFYKDNADIPIPEYWTTEDPYDFSSVYLDGGKGSSRGVELFVQKKYSNNWYGTLAYSYSDSRLIDPQDSSRYFPSDFDCRHVFTAMSGYKFEFHKTDWYGNLSPWVKYTVGTLVLSDEADLGFRFRYASGRPYTPMEWIPETRQWVTNGDLVNSERYPAFHRLDLRWDHKFIFNRWSLAWYVEVQNLYDRINIWGYSYLDDGTVDTTYQFGLFPMGGLVIEF